MKRGDEGLPEEQSDPLILPEAPDESAPSPLPSTHFGAPRHSHLSAALRVVVGLVLAGVLVGALWAWLAPPIQIVIALARNGDRVRGYVGDEANNLFLAAFELVGFLFVLAVVSAALVWKWRPHRGPGMVAALALGLTAAAAVAVGVGAALAHWRYGTIDVMAAPVSPEHRVHYAFEAPGVLFGHSGWQPLGTILFPAGIAALVYATFALAAKRDDLGSWPPVEPTYRVIDPIPTAADAPPVDQSSPSR